MLTIDIIILYSIKSMSLMKMQFEFQFIQCMQCMRMQFDDSIYPVLVYMLDRLGDVYACLIYLDV